MSGHGGGGRAARRRVEQRRREDEWLTKTLACMANVLAAAFRWRVAQARWVFAREVATARPYVGTGLFKPIVG